MIFFTYLWQICGKMGKTNPTNRLVVGFVIESLYLFDSCGAGVKGETDNHYFAMMEIVDKEKFEEMFFKAWNTRDIKKLKRCAKYLLNRGIVVYWEPCEDERMDKLPWWAWAPAIIMSALALAINLWKLLQ